jgi:hypothetical protein
MHHADAAAFLDQDELVASHRERVPLEVDAGLTPQTERRENRLAGFIDWLFSPPAGTHRRAG